MRRIAIVIPDLNLGGGVPSMGWFLYNTIRSSGCFEPNLISLATSANDPTSVRLIAPNSWFKGVQVAGGMWKGIAYKHVGAHLTEFEFQRYQPRKILTELLEQYDLIQVVAGGPAAGLVISKASKPKCMFVATTVYQERKARLGQVQGYRKFWLRLMTYATAKIESDALSKMDHVFAESAYTCSLIAGKVSKHRLSLGVPGIDTNLFRPDDQYNMDSYILSVGRFADPRKNLYMLLDAYRRLRSSFAKAPRLVLAGLDRPTARDWKAAVAWGIADYIDLYINVSTTELAELYRKAALFVLSSNEEGLGIVILEAMASGIPVVSTCCGGPETAVTDGETGCLTPVGDAYLLAEKMRTLLANASLRQYMAKNARKIAETSFSFAAAGNVYLNKYGEILGLR